LLSELESKSRHCLLLEPASAPLLEDGTGKLLSISLEQCPWSDCVTLLEAHPLFLPLLDRFLSFWLKPGDTGGEAGGTISILTPGELGCGEIGCNTGSFDAELDAAAFFSAS
jgi:hypothetical protein